MSTELRLWQAAGSVFTAVAGTLLHFVYGWSNQSVIAAPFAAVNESTWEHMKLLFFPMFVFAFVEYLFIGRKYENFFVSKLAGISLGLVMIPVLYYTCIGAFGNAPGWYNILIFLLAVAATFLLETRLMSRKPVSRIWNVVAVVILCIFALAFVILTFVQPKIPLFEDPVGSFYGIKQ